MRALLFLGSVLLALAAACGGQGPALSRVPAAEVLQRARQAMAEQQGFTAAMAGLPAGSPWILQYGAPDLLSVTGDGGVDCPHHILLAGKHVYGSEVGSRWERDVCREMVFWRIALDPRDQLRLAINLVDEGDRALDGRTHRLIAAELDVDRFYTDYLEAIQDLRVRVSAPSSVCAQVRGAVPPAQERFRELGYRAVGGSLVRCLELFKDNVRVEVSDSFMDPFVDFRVFGVASLTPALRQEFAAVLEALGVPSELLNDAQVTASTGGLELFLDEYRGRRLRFWIDAETYLVSQVEGVSGEGEGALSFDYRVPLELQAPAEVMNPAEAQALNNATQDGWKVLWKALEVYAAAHDGLHPEELTLESLGEALTSKGLTWPINPFTGEPMRDTTEDSPGGFSYEASPDRLDYSVRVYGWDGPVMYRPLRSELPPPLVMPTTPPALP